MTHTLHFASAQNVIIIKLFLKRLNSPARPNLIDYVHVITFFFKSCLPRLSVFRIFYFFFIFYVENRTARCIHITTREMYSSALRLAKP